MSQILRGFCVVENEVLISNQYFTTVVNMASLITAKCFSKP